MKTTKRIILTLVALIGMTSAWAQDTAPEVTWNAATKTGTFTMPAYDVEVQVEYDDETTAIISIKGGKVESVTYYDLSGRRIANPTKGIYIKDGKKVVVK